MRVSLKNLFDKENIFYKGHAYAVEFCNECEDVETGKLIKIPPVILDRVVKFNPAFEEWLYFKNNEMIAIKVNEEHWKNWIELQEGKYEFDLVEKVESDDNLKISALANLEKEVISLIETEYNYYRDTDKIFTITEKIRVSIKTLFIEQNEEAKKHLKRMLSMLVIMDCKLINGNFKEAEQISFGVLGNLYYILRNKELNNEK